MSLWDDLSMREKAAMMRVAVRNRMFDIDLIKEAYNNLDRLVSNSEVINPNLYTPSVNLNVNPALDYVGNALESISGYEYEGNPLNKLGIDMSFDVGTTGSRMYPNGIKFVKKFGEGGNYTVGNLVDAIYLNNPKEEHLGRPSHNYDFTQSEEWANAHGYYPDARGHRDDRVKKPAHPSHPSRGTWQGDNFILTDKGFEDPNYTLFGLNDGGQDPLATLIYDDAIVLPEITVTPNGKYINNSYDNIRLHLKSNGGPNKFFDGGYVDPTMYGMPDQFTPPITYEDYVDPKTPGQLIGKTALLLLDFTGVSSYPDVINSYEEFKKDPGFVNGLLLGLNALSSIPLIGKVGKTGDLVNNVASAIKPAVKLTVKATRAAKGQSTSGKAFNKAVKKAVKKETEKALLDNSLIHQGVLNVNSTIDTLPELFWFTRKGAEKTLDLTTKYLTLPIFNNWLPLTAKSYRTTNAAIDYLNFSRNLGAFADYYNYYYKDNKDIKNNKETK